DPAELDDAALARMRALILDTLDDPVQLAQWFGRVMTQPKYVDQLVANDEPSDIEALVATLQDGEELVRSPGSRFAWRTMKDDQATLFADGDGIPCDLQLARAVASDRPLDAEVLALDGAPEVLTQLLDTGSLGWVGEFDTD
ncbi:MAG TPA: winged helix domain-containing protein, partial [Halomonas sp.]|nr:winged helix domain-containing protein [Halomonas sp.]